MIHDRAIDPAAFDAIAFDLDGTLIDTAPDIRHALNTALREAGLPPCDLASVQAWIGDGPDVLIARALAAHGAAGDADMRTRLRRGFDAATLAAPLQFGSVYPGIGELLAGLRERVPMAVVTNKPTALARAVLDKAQLLASLSMVFGADAALHRKPAPHLLLATADRLGVARHRLLMVGDSSADLLAAQAAGCPAVLALWGYGAHAVADGLARWRIDTPDQLAASLMLHPRRQPAAPLNA